jgi:hypothetical protein
VYAVLLAFLSVRFLGGNEDAGGADPVADYLFGSPENLGGSIGLSTSDSRVQKGHVALDLPCDDARVQPWRWTIGRGTIEHRGNKVSARVVDHSHGSESVRWRFFGRLTGTVTDGGQRASGEVHMVLRYWEPGGRTGVCDTDEGEYWKASTR